MKVSGQGCKTRYLPLHLGTHGLVSDFQTDERAIDDRGI